MAATPNLLGIDDAVLRLGKEAEVAEVANQVASEEAAGDVSQAVMPRAAEAVPETRRAERAALLQPKLIAARFAR